MVEHFQIKIVKHIPYCNCGAMGVLCEKYDAYFCPASFIWLEGKCDDFNCEFCSHRPETAQLTSE